MRSWLVGVTLFLLMALVATPGFNLVGVFFPALTRDLGWSMARASSLFTAMVLAAAMTSPVVGRLLEISEARSVIGAGVLASALGFGLAGLVSSFLPMLGAYALLGIGLGMSTYVPAPVLISAWFTDRPALALGLVNAGQSIGIMVLTPALTYLLAFWGWRTAIITLTLPMLLVVLPLVLLTLKAAPIQCVLESPVPMRSSFSAGVEYEGLDVSEALKTFAFWMLVTIQLGSTLAGGTVFVHLFAFLISVGYKTSGAGIALSLVGGISGVAAPMVGLVTDHVGARKTLAFSFLILGVAILVLLEAHSVTTLFISIVLFSVSVGANMIIVPILLNDTLGLKCFRLLFGILEVPFFLGVALGPLIAGWLFDFTGSYTITFRSCAVACGVCLMASLYCTRPEQHSKARANAALEIGTRSLSEK